MTWVVPTADHLVFVICTLFFTLTVLRYARDLAREEKEKRGYGRVVWPHDRFLTLVSGAEKWMKLAAADRCRKKRADAVII